MALHEGAVVDRQVHRSAAIARGLAGRVRELADVHRGRRFHAARFDVRERENLTEERLDARRRFADARYETACLLGLGQGALVEHLGARAHGGHRIFELVRQVRGERLQKGSALQLATHGVDGAGEAVHLSPVRHRGHGAGVPFADAHREARQALDRRRDRPPDGGGSEGGCGAERHADDEHGGREVGEEAAHDDGRLDDAHRAQSRSLAPRWPPPR